MMNIHPTCFKSKMCIAVNLIINDPFTFVYQVLILIVTTTQHCKSTTNIVKLNETY